MISIVLAEFRSACLGVFLLEFFVMVMAEGVVHGDQRVVETTTVGWDM
jgi:hypothetical protein